MFEHPHCKCNIDLDTKHGFLVKPAKNSIFFSESKSILVQIVSSWQAPTYVSGVYCRLSRGKLQEDVFALSAFAGFGRTHSSAFYNLRAYIR